MASDGQRTPLVLDFDFVVETVLPFDVDERDLQQLSVFLLKAEGGTGEWHVTIALVDGERLQALHRDFMGVDEPTDIMTFPHEVEGGAVQGGELVISFDHARDRSAEWGVTPVEEIRFLVAHGLLHLLGWRDETEEQRRNMLDRQHELLERLPRQV